MLSNELKKYLYGSIIDTIELRLLYKNRYNQSYIDGLLGGLRYAFVGDRAFMYVYNAINELDVDAIKSLLWYDCDARA